MKNIGGFFEKFNNKLGKQIYNLDLIVEVIRKNTGIFIDMSDVSVKNGVLRIKGSSLMKNEIYIKKVRILKELEEKLRGQKISDIL